MLTASTDMSLEATSLVAKGPVRVDGIVTSGENDNYKRDIPIGTISKVEEISYNSSLYIEITPIIDFSKLENIVVINHKELNTNR